MQEVELETPNPALVVTYRDLSSIHNSGFIHEANSNPHSSTGHQRFVPGPSLRARHVEDGQHRSTQRMTNPNSCPFGLAMGVFSQSCMPKLGGSSFSSTMGGVVLGAVPFASCGRRLSWSNLYN